MSAAGRPALTLWGLAHSWWSRVPHLQRWPALHGSGGLLREEQGKATRQGWGHQTGPLTGLQPLYLGPRLQWVSGGSPSGRDCVPGASAPKPSVLSTPQLSRGRVSAGSHHQSAKSSRPPGCLGPSSAGGCAPKAPGGRGPFPLSMPPGHSHRPPAAMQPRALSCGPAWTPPRGRDHHQPGAGGQAGSAMEKVLLWAPGRHQDPGPSHVHQARHQATGGPQGAHGLPGGDVGVGGAWGRVRGLP